MEANTVSNRNAFDRLINFIEAGGPEESQYDELTQIWDSLNMEDSSTSNFAAGNRIVELFGCDFFHQTIQGFGYRKPHGYSGDFEMIDYIYQLKTCADMKFQKWDKYFHAQEAPKAVRNRKEYFIKLVVEKCATSIKPLKLLNIASGPCRDILELLEQISSDNLIIHCVEMDPRAIDYARNVLGSLSSTVRITQKNIFRFSTEEKYDLIWSAGLFDYFDDVAFVKLLAKVSSWCAPAGEIVVGNFSVSNPSRSYMEKAGNWYLFHRTHEKLRELAVKAGFKGSQVDVRCESLGVNLFLHAKMH